jgi:twitching motility two-component system response regulator PilH
VEFDLSMSRAKSILVVDPDPDTIQFIGLILENEGYRVVSARDGDEALQKLADAKPDLILLEILVPRRNGYQLCRAIKADPTHRTVPVLFVSAKAQPSDRFWAKRVGADGFVAKPFDPAELLREIHSLLQQKRVATPRGGA